ncbi:HD-GYP domain-containing protein [Paenibacillus sp. RC67]|uniref:HD-GYP domain-containing protein n=1 Tax=Paenibacillus sp. RC67 TaxID=3039392 RepID=UPI0024AE1CFD|nr:HD-GYP domain-containing protein [Paenibacillus sp. RC67]
MSLGFLLGKRTDCDIINAAGLVLVPSGFVVDEEHLRLLDQHQVKLSEVTWMGNGRNESISTLDDKVQKVFQYNQDLFDRIYKIKKVPLLEIKNELLPIVQEISEYPDLFQLLAAMKRAEVNTYTFQHHIGVAVLTTLIGKWIGLEKTDLSLLTLAAILHDVGKVRISEDLWLKPGKLTDEEFAEIKLHTVYGYELLKATIGLSPRVAKVALLHHERSDGNGYPLKLKGSRLDTFSRIVAVADVFHAMSSKRPYRDTLSFHEVVSRMRKGAFGQIDPHISAMFLENIICSLIGKQVMLTDGQIGEVVYTNPHNDLRPLIRIGESLVNLSEMKQLHIADVLV